MRRLIILTLATTALAAPAAEAQRSPAGCSDSRLALDLSRNRATVRPGDVVTYGVTLTNQGANACDVTGAKTTFTPPGGVAATLDDNRDLPAGTDPMRVGSPEWVVPADQPAGSAVASAKVEGTLHDSPDGHQATVAKTLNVDVVVPKLQLTLTAEPAEGVAPLDVTFHLKVKNLSAPAKPVSALDIDHPACDAATLTGGDTGSDGVFDAGEEWDFTCKRTFLAGEYSGSAAVSGTSDLDGNGVFATAPAVTVKVSRPASTAHLKLTKTASPLSGIAPLNVTYSYTVENDGPSTPIKDIAVEDAGCGPVTTTAASTPLAAGVSRVFTCAATFGPGIFSSGAIATGIDTITDTRVNSDPASVEVTADRPPDPITRPTAEPTPTPTPTPKPSTNVSFSYTGRFTPARSCRGTVTLTLKAGSKKLATKRVKLDAKCRYKVAFTVARTRLGKATKATVTAKAGGRSASRTLAVPKR